MRLAVLALALFSAPASAEAYFEKWLGSIGAVEMEKDAADLTLYASPSGQTVPFVKVTIGENDYLFALMSNSRTVMVSESVIKEQKLKLSSKNQKFINLKGKDNKFKVGGEFKVGTLDQLTIEGVVFKDLEVVNFPKAGSGVDAAQGGRSWYSSRTSALALDGAIGLDALPEGINWAVLPSEGVVRLTRGAATTLADGQTIPVVFRPAASSRIGRGPFKRQLDIAASHTATGVKLAGVEVPAELELGAVKSMVVWPSLLPSESVIEHGDVGYRLLEATVEGQPLGSVRALSLTAPQIINRKTQKPFEALSGANRAYLGQDLLWAYDVSRDRAQGTITLKKAAEQKRQSPLGFMIAEALKKVQPSEESAADGEAPAEGAQSEAPAVPGSASDWSDLAELYAANNQLPEALEAAANATTLDERDCTDWSRRGKLQKLAGDIEGAVTSFEKASTLYHAWYDLPLEQRVEIKKGLDKLKGDEKKNAEHYVASGSCHTADGHLAEAKFAAGDLPAIEPLYRDHLDLDRSLAVVTGNALIVQGEFDHAIEPLRQALKFPGTNAHARLALGVVYAEKGDWDSADKLMQRANALLDDAQGLLVWSDALAKAKGDDARRSALNALIAQYPDADGPRLALAYAVSGSVDVSLKQKTKRGSAKHFERSVQQAKQTNSRQANYARWLNQWEPGSDAALAAAEKAVAMNPGSAGAKVAMAEVLAARGETEQAAQWTLKAAQTQPGHIGYARLIAQ